MKPDDEAPRAEDLRGDPSRPLTPGREPARWERAVAAVMERAGPELARRAGRSPGGVAVVVDRWARPLLAAAAGLVLAAASLMVAGGRTDGPPAAGPAVDARIRPAATGAGLQEVVYPGRVAAWMEGDYEPTVEEIVFSAPAATAPRSGGGRP